MREQAATARQPRTVFGGRVREGRPLVTWSIIAVTVLAFLLQHVPGLDLTERLAYVPVTTAREPWRMLTVLLVHEPNSIFHIGFNMYALWAIGQTLEPLLGRARFLALYLVSGLGSSVVVLLLASPVELNWLTTVVGASGAIFGLFSALVIILRRLGGPVRQVLVLIAINAVLGFVLPNVAWQGHLGGLLTGALVAAVLVFAPRQGRTPIQVAGIAGVVVLLIALTVIKALAAPVGAFTFTV